MEFPHRSATTLQRGPIEITLGGVQLVAELWKAETSDPAQRSILNENEDASPRDIWRTARGERTTTLTLTFRGYDSNAARELINGFLSAQK